MIRPELWPVSSTFVTKIKRKYRRQLWPAYILYRRVRANALRTAIQKRRLAARNSTLSPDERRLLKRTRSRISYMDTMYKGDGDHYFKVGLSAIECIDAALDSAGKAEAHDILDLPCGHGRVLRFLASRFPDANAVGCDIDRHGVDFCVRAFGVTPFYSQLDLASLNIGKKFDLIWCGSLITHLRAGDTTDLLRFFRRNLAPGGLLVFSAHGDFVADKIRSGRGTEYHLSDEPIADLLAAYDGGGHGYADYPKAQPGYGLALTSPAWIRGQLRAIGGWNEVYFREHQWDDHHDIWGVKKRQ